jgi:hypothetical protein
MSELETKLRELANNNNEKFSNELSDMDNLITKRVETVKAELEAGLKGKID